MLFNERDFEFKQQKKELGVEFKYYGYRRALKWIKAFFREFEAN